MFKRNDKVMISKDSPYYNSKEKKNPHNTEGVITDINELSNYIHVVWSNGESNIYSSEDLVHVNNDVDILFFNKIINYKSTKETFPSSERIPTELTKENLEELGEDVLDIVRSLLLRYDKCLNYAEEYISLLEKILENNLEEIKLKAGLFASDEKTYKKYKITNRESKFPINNKYNKNSMNNSSKIFDEPDIYKDEDYPIEDEYYEKE